MTLLKQDMNIKDGAVIHMRNLASEGERGPAREQR